MDRSTIKYWVLAARPKTLPASVVPVLVACALAFKNGYFRFIPAAICFAFAIIAQIISNFLNDYFDYVKGSDRDDRLGPERAVAQGWIRPKSMLTASIILIAIAALLGSILIYYAGWMLIGVGIAVCIGVFAYSSGPFPLAYNGLGDLCVVIFYGLVPVCFTYYVQSLHWNEMIFICGLCVGIVSTNILVANNYRDRDQDKISKKNTTVVLFGEKFGRIFYLSNGIAAVLLYFYFNGKMTFTAALPFFYWIPHFMTWREMCRIRQGKELNVILGKSSINTIIFGLLLSASVLLS